MSTPRLSKMQHCLLGVLLAAAPLCASGCGGAPQQKEEDGLGGVKAAVVAPVKSQKKLFVRTIELPGYIAPIETTPLHAKVTGYVESIAVDIGDRITGPHGDKPGSILCELLVPELREELAEKLALCKQAEAFVAQAEAGIKVAEAAANSAKARLEEAKAGIAKEESLVARWKSEYERVLKLSEDGVVTKKVAEEAKSEMSAAESSQQEALAKVTSAEALAQEGLAHLAKSEADLTATQSKLAVAEAEKRRLESLVEYSKIRAPYDGVVVERRVHTGHLVQEGGTSGGHLFSVMRIDPIRLTVDVPEAEAVHVAKGSKIRFRAPGGKGDPVEAGVSRTSWSLNEASRTLQVEVDLANADGQWRPGSYLQVSLVVAEIPDAICIPKTAVFLQNKLAYCYVIGGDGTLQKRQIELGVASGEEWQVKQGLSGDENLIGRNVGSFREGQLVETAAPAAK